MEYGVFYGAWGMSCQGDFPLCRPVNDDQRYCDLTLLSIHQVQLY